MDWKAAGWLRPAECMIGSPAWRVRGNFCRLANQGSRCLARL